MVSQGDRTSQRHEANRKILNDTALRLGLTPRQVCEMASPTVGTATWFEFQETGIIPVWLEMWSYSVLTSKPKKAANLLGGTCHVPPELTARVDPTIGLSSADLESDAM